MYTNVMQWGDKLLIRGVDSTGERYSQKLAFQPTIWTTSNTNKESAWRTLDGRKVFDLQPGGIKDTKEYIERYSDVTGIEMFQSPGNIYQYIAEQYKGEIRWDPTKVVVFTVDIETSVEAGFPDPALANEQILLITIKDRAHKRLVTFGLGPYEHQRKDLMYIQCTSEQQLLLKFIGWWQLNYPDAITGWNSSLFDVTYLYNRMVKVLGEELAVKLSPWGKVNQRPMDLGGRSVIKTYLAGIALLDYLDLYKKFTYSAQESYKLDYIAYVELGERKLENPGTGFKDFYTNHWQTFVTYNIKDTELVDKLDDKMKLLDLVMTMAYDAKVNYEDVFSPVKTWDVIIYNYLNNHGIVTPPLKASHKLSTYQGAYVKDPLIGRHKWVCTFDLNSLYPHLIMQYNLSPETISDLKLDVTVDQLLRKEAKLDEAIDRDLAVAANGWCFKRDEKGLLPTLMQLYYDRRVIAKKQMLAARQQNELTPSQELKNEISRLNNLQMATKILLNSAYGAFGNAHFRYFDVRIAEAITVSGQLSIRWIANALNDWLNKAMLTSDVDRVVLIDTDSVVLSLSDIVEKTCGGKSTEEIIAYMDKTADQVIQPFIDKSYQRLASYVNAYEQKMQMKRENLASVMISVSKKRYAMLVHNSEGVQYKTPKLKVMGLQMVKSSTPAVIRDKLREALPVILDGTEQQVQQFVADFRSKFNELPVEQIAFPRGISDVSKYASSTSVFTKGCPIHVRGALLYNHHIKRLGLDTIYPQIREGDKIKFVYLKTPNPFQQDCIGFPDVLPPEFNLTKYIDYKTMYSKVFEDAIQNILDSMGWNVTPQATLEDWFA